MRVVSIHVFQKADGIALDDNRVFKTQAVVAIPVVMKSKYCLRKNK